MSEVTAYESTRQELMRYPRRWLATNVFGRRQNPAGAYAAVIPRWFRRLVDGGE